MLYHELYYPACHVGAHGVVYSAAAEDDFGVVSHGLGLPGEVVGVYAYAVAAHKAGPEGEEVPLGSRRFEDVQGVNSHFVEDEGKFVYEGDVDVPLGVFYYLGGLGLFYAAGKVGPAGTMLL